MNLSLAFFNMIPLFPLDGSHILEGLLPYRLAVKYKGIERYSPFILLGLIILGNYAGYFDFKHNTWPTHSLLSQVIYGFATLSEDR